MVSEVQSDEGGPELMTAVNGRAMKAKGSA
jgi:hypothetical protein